MAAAFEERVEARVGQRLHARRTLVSAYTSDTTYTTLAVLVAHIATAQSSPRPQHGPHRSAQCWANHSARRGRTMLLLREHDRVQIGLCFALLLPAVLHVERVNTVDVAQLREVQRHELPAQRSAAVVHIIVASHSV